MDDPWAYPENGADPWVYPYPSHLVQDHSALSLSILAKGKGPQNLPNPSGFLASRLQCFEDWPCAPTRHGSEAWCSVCLASSGPRVKRYLEEPHFLFITCPPPDGRLQA